MSKLELGLGQAAYLTRGLNDSWSPVAGRLDITYAPPNQPLAITAAVPPEQRGSWGDLTVTLHSDARSLLTELLPYRVASPSAESDAVDLPVGSLVLGAARNDAALTTLSATLGVDLRSSDLGYALVKVSRRDGELSHQSHPDNVLIYSRLFSPDAAGISKSFRTAMSKLDHAGLRLPAGWPAGYGLAAMNKTLEFQRSWGTHYVSKIAVGDAIWQVFAYPRDKFQRVVNAYAKQPEKLRGPRAVDFVQFTTNANTGSYGYVKQYGKLLNLSHCAAFQASLNTQNWVESSFAKQDSLFALFDSGAMNLDTLDRDFREQAPVMVTLASMGVHIEFTRSQYWARVLKGALAQKYEDTIPITVPVADQRDFEAMLPEDLPELLTTLATPTINVYSGRLDMSAMQFVAAEQVREFTVLTQVISASKPAPVVIPGRTVRLFAQTFDLRSAQGITTWLLDDAAFAGAELAGSEFLGGLALRNRSGTAYSFILDGLRLGLQGTGRDAEPVVVADLRTTPTEAALPSLQLSLQLAMNLMDSLLSYQCACPGGATPCPGDQVQRFARAGCEWYAHFIPASTTDPELLALRVQALDLARRVHDPAYGAAVPILPSALYAESVTKILDYVDAIQQELRYAEQQLANRKLAELTIDVGKTLNQNIIDSGKLLRGIIDTSRAQQDDLVGYYDVILTQLAAESQAQREKADKLGADLLTAKGDVDNCVAQYNTAVERQQIEDGVKFALDVATQLFSLGVAIALPASAIVSVQKLGLAAQRVQKTLNVANATYTLYATITKEVGSLTSASKALDELGSGQFGSTSSLPWDELSIRFKEVMSLGPQGSRIKEAQAALQAAFDIMILRGKAVTSAQSELSRIQRDSYTNQRQKELNEAQAKRLAALDTSLAPANVQDLDTAAIDLVGLSGTLYSIQRQMMSTLSSAFLLRDQALQYENLQPPTPITSFSLLSFKSACVAQETAKVKALSALAPLQLSMTTPIAYVMEGIPVAELSGGARKEFCIRLDAAEFREYVNARIVAVVAVVEGVAGTTGGKLLVQLDYSGSPFADRDPQRRCLDFHTPGRSRAYQYEAATGKPLFVDGGTSWSQAVSRITPFSTWAISLPNTELNRGLKFTRQTVTVRLEFTLEARIVDLAGALPRVTGGKTLLAAVPSATAAPSTAALVAALAWQGSCTNGWDVVFNMSLAQINEALGKQYETLKNNPAFDLTIDVQTAPTKIQGSIYGFQKFHIAYGYPRMTFLANNDDQVQLQMEILKDSYVQYCSCDKNGENIKCDPPESITGETLTVANVPLDCASATVSGDSVLDVVLRMAKGAFAVEGMDLSDDQALEFNKALKSYFQNNPIDFLINRLDITLVPTLQALKPHAFLFKLLRTDAKVDLLQLFIQTGDRALRDRTQAFLNNVPEPLPDGQPYSMLVRSELFFGEVLPQSLGTGWKLVKDGPTSSGAWRGKLTQATVNGNVNLSALNHHYHSGHDGATTDTDYTYSVASNPVPWSLAGSLITPESDGRLKLSGTQTNTMDYNQHWVQETSPCYYGNCTSSGTDKLQTDFQLTVSANLPLRISGSGREQSVGIDTSPAGVTVNGHVSGGGPCKSDDLEAQVNQQLAAQLPAQISGNLHLPFNAISVFALKNLLFPEGNYIEFTEAYAPGDFLIVGKSASVGK